MKTKNNNYSKNEEYAKKTLTNICDSLYRVAEIKTILKNREEFLSNFIGKNSLFSDAYIAFNNLGDKELNDSSFNIFKNELSDIAENICDTIKKASSKDKDFASYLVNVTLKDYNFETLTEKIINTK